MDSRKKIKLQKEVLLWYKKHKRKFLWRDNKNPYVIFVSEIMLQQTQVERVQSKLPEFLNEFPTVQALSQSSQSFVLRKWKGMGYNNRAVRLLKSAKIIVDKLGGNIPSSKEILQTLPGVGEYTSSAISVFAFKANISVVDVNIRRVYSRLFWDMRTFSSTQTEKKIFFVSKCFQYSIYWKL